MRTAIFAMLLLASSPSAATECFYSNQNDQRLIWTGGDVLVFDPRYTDTVTCRLTAIPNTNAFNADCDGYSRVLVTGASTREARDADILVFDGVFYWLQCVKDHA